MIPDGEVVLFAVTLKRQAGGDMYAGLFGRLEPVELARALEDHGALRRLLLEGVLALR